MQRDNGRFAMTPAGHVGVAELATSHCLNFEALEGDEGVDYKLGGGMEPE
jgi:hypothetical protein